MIEARGGKLGVVVRLKNGSILYWAEARTWSVANGVLNISLTSRTAEPIAQLAGDEVLAVHALPGPSEELPHA